MTSKREESAAEKKIVGEVLTDAVEEADGFYDLLQRHNFNSWLQVTAWISRFVHTCQKHSKNRRPVTTDNLE